MRNICIAIIFLFMFSWLIAGEDYREIRLKSHWKFQIGDDMTYANTDFDDSQWSTIRIRKKWEDQGYPAYDGYAWYRTKFYLSKKIKGKSLNLYLGNIDDVDAVYMNGQYIGGHGQFPPHYNTAYNIDRKYHLLAKNLFYGDENVIAVRVYDHEGSGGIMWGRVGVYSEFTVKIYYDLSGKWKFNTGDSKKWAREDFDDSGWDQVAVPMVWESQGYPNHDGYGWYRTTFRIDEDFIKKDLFMALGLIDDIDEVYLNGVLIGHTGRLPDEHHSHGTSHWKDERFYYLPTKLIHWSKDNVLAVRVYDAEGAGGIYSGSIGITTRKDYLRYRREKKNKRTLNFIHDLLDGIFNR